MRLSLRRRWARIRLQARNGVRWISRTPELIVWSGVTIALAILFSAAALLGEGRKLVIARAADNQRNIAEVLQRDIELNFRLYEVSLDAVVRLLARPDVAALPPNLRRDLIFERSGASSYIGVLVVLDAQGNIVIDAAGETPRAGNFADRDYFVVQRDHPDTGLYVSGLLQSRLRNGLPTMTLSRRLSNPDGSFAGVVSLSLNNEYFHSLFEQLTLGPHGTIVVLGKNGKLLMRHPYDASAIGKTLAQTGAFTNLPPGDDNVLSTDVRVDGLPAMMVRRRLDDVPLTLLVTASLDDILAPWRARAWLFGGLIGLLGVGFIVTSVLLAAQLRRRLHAEKELRLLARTDGLTGLSNRRSLDYILANEWRRMRRADRPMAVAFVDIDWFKRYNDTHGHQAGDAALAAVAGAIAGALRRTSDSAGRYGGEEFVAVMPDTDVAGARAIGEAIRAAVEHLGLEHASSDFGHVTVSIGVACGSPVARETVDALVKAADDAVYQAKAKGRNRVVVGGALCGGL